MTEQIIRNETISLRAVEPTDVDALYQWENDPSLWAVSNIAGPVPRSALWQYLESYDRDLFTARQLRLMVTLTATGEAVGAVDITNFDPLNNRAELGIVITGDRRGAGLGEQALRLTVGYLHGYLGIDNLYALVPVGNEACRALFAKAGFTASGTLRRWINHGSERRDVELLQLLL